MVSKDIRKNPIVGSKFGKLTITEILPLQISENYINRQVICKCDCGNIVKRRYLEISSNDNDLKKTRACKNCMKNLSQQEKNYIYIPNIYTPTNENKNLNNNNIFNKIKINTIDNKLEEKKLYLEQLEEKIYIRRRELKVLDLIDSRIKYAIRKKKNQEKKFPKKNNYPINQVLYFYPSITTLNFNFKYNLLDMNNEEHNAYKFINEVKIYYKGNFVKSITSEKYNTISECKDHKEEFFNYVKENTTVEEIEKYIKENNISIYDCKNYPLDVLVKELNIDTLAVNVIKSTLSDLCKLLVFKNHLVNRYNLKEFIDFFNESPFANYIDISTKYMLEQCNINYDLLFEYYNNESIERPKTFLIDEKKDMYEVLKRLKWD